MGYWWAIKKIDYFGKGSSRGPNSEWIVSSAFGSMSTDFLCQCSFNVNLGRSSELQIKKIPVRHWVLQVREFCQTYFFFRTFLIFHFQYSMIKGTILKP